MTYIINGRVLSRALRLKLKENELVLFERFKISTTLAIIMVGGSPASELNVNTKKKCCKELGIDFKEFRFSSKCDIAEIYGLIHTLNNDDSVNAVSLQLPLPLSFANEQTTQTLIETISPTKDVECLHPLNIGKLLTNTAVVQPCVPAAIIDMIGYAGQALAGTTVAMIGAGSIGKPTTLLLLANDATVITCNSFTKDLPEKIENADVIIAAAGHPELIKGSWIKEGAVVIDVGVNRVGGKIVGDVEFSEAAKRAKAISPVPGGVGPLAITKLLQNVIDLTYYQNQKRIHGNL